MSPFMWKSSTTALTFSSMVIILSATWHVSQPVTAIFLYIGKVEATPNRTEYFESMTQISFKVPSISTVLLTERRGAFTFCCDLSIGCVGP